MMRLKINLTDHPILSKSLWSLLVLFVFEVGKNIPLPYTDAESAIKGSYSIKALTQATGGNLNQLSLFSLGIGPWMMAMIIVSVLQQSKRLGLSKKPQRVMTQIQFGLVMLIAALQATVSVFQINFTTDTDLIKFENGVVLVAGAFFVMWLSNMNAKYGIGGIMFLVLANIIQSMMGTILTVVQRASKIPAGLLMLIVGGLVALAFLSWLSVMMDHGEFRVPLRRLLIDNRYSEKSYLPIKLTPANGMPLMFVMSFASLPVYLFAFLKHFLPHNRIVLWGIVNFQLTKFWGVTFYVGMIFVLSMMFAFINIDPQKRAEEYQHSGDYIPGYRPGRATEKYLRQLVWHFGLFGAVYLTIFAGLPMYLAVGNPTLMQVMMLPGLVLMTIGFGMMMLDQIKSLMVQGKYKTLL